MGSQVTSCGCQDDHSSDEIVTLCNLHDVHCEQMCGGEATESYTCWQQEEAAVQVNPAAGCCEDFRERCAEPPEPTFSTRSDARLQAYIARRQQMRYGDTSSHVFATLPEVFTAPEQCHLEGLETFPWERVGEAQAGAVLDQAKGGYDPLGEFDGCGLLQQEVLEGKNLVLQQPDVGPEIQQQLDLGPQSKRGNAPWFQIDVLDHHPHARECFRSFERNEEALCGEWAVFYHSYNFGALVYEINTAIYSMLFKVDSAQSCIAPMPRLFVHEFAGVPNAASLKNKFQTELAAAKHDHEPAFRAVAISAMCSLVALGPEASTPVVFVGGYSHADDPVNFRKTLVDLFFSLVASYHCPKKKTSMMKKLSDDIEKLVDKMINLSEKHGLDVSGFGGKPCPPGKTGHLLQIFIKRDHVDQLAYAAQPFGIVDVEREPLSKWLDSDEKTNWGQARILAHPEFFMNPSYVRLYAASANPLFHSSRKMFQLELMNLIRQDLLFNASLQESAAAAIYGADPPSGWVPSK